MLGIKRETDYAVRTILHLALRHVRFDALPGGRRHVGAHRKLVRPRGTRA